MSDSVWPHRWQPTKLLCLWDFPGKNTRVGCHFLLQGAKVKSESEVAQSCLTQRPHGLQPTRLLCSWDFPGKSTGVGFHCLLPVTMSYTFLDSTNKVTSICLCISVRIISSRFIYNVANWKVLFSFYGWICHWIHVSLAWLLWPMLQWTWECR